MSLVDIFINTKKSLPYTPFIIIHTELLKISISLAVRHFIIYIFTNTKKVTPMYIYRILSNVVKQLYNTFYK